MIDKIYFTSEDFMKRGYQKITNTLSVIKLPL